MLCVCKCVCIFEHMSVCACAHVYMHMFAYDQMCDDREKSIEKKHLHIENQTSKTDRANAKQHKPPKMFKT